MIAKILMNTIVNILTKQVTNILGDKITFQNVMKLCVLGGGVMFFVLGFDLMTIAAILIIIISIASYYIYFKKGINPLKTTDTQDSNLPENAEEKDLQDLNQNLEQKTEEDPALLLRFPELDALLESLQKISKTLLSSENEIDKKQNANLIDMTNSLLEETTSLYQQLKDDKQTQPLDDQKLNDIAIELNLELDSLLVKYQADNDQQKISFIENYKTILSDLLLKIKKKN